MRSYAAVRNFVYSESRDKTFRRRLLLSRLLSSAVLVKKRFAITTFGFLITPLIAAALLTTVEVIVGSLRPQHQVLGWVFVLYLYALTVTVIFALPVFLVLSRVNKVSWWWGLLTGLFCGALPLVFLGVTVAAIPVGGISGLLFWLIWRWGDNSDGNDDIGKVASGSE